MIEIYAVSPLASDQTKEEDNNKTDSSMSYYDLLFKQGFSSNKTRKYQTINQQKTVPTQDVSWYNSIDEQTPDHPVIHTHTVHTYIIERGKRKEITNTSIPRQPERQEIHSIHPLITKLDHAQSSYHHIIHSEGRERQHAEDCDLPQVSNEHIIICCQPAYITHCDCVTDRPPPCGHRRRGYLV